MKLTATVGETEVEVATFGCSLSGSERTLTSAPADSSLGLLSPLLSPSSLPLFRLTVPVAVLHASNVGIVAMAFRIFSARVASNFPYISKFRKHVLQMQPQVLELCPSPINVVLSTPFPHRCNSKSNTFSHSGKILRDGSLPKSSGYQLKSCSHNQDSYLPGHSTT